MGPALLLARVGASYNPFIWVRGQSSWFILKRFGHLRLTRLGLPDGNARDP
jgi:hypothetical protein